MIQTAKLPTTARNKMREQKNQAEQEKYYYPSVKNSSCFFKDSFDLRFPELTNSLVNSGFCGALYNILKWRCSYTNLGYPEDEQKLKTELPVVAPTFPTDDKKITYTWIGHSTAVISFGKDANFLIDPVFGERASPFQWIGPKRFRPLPCTIQQLPKIDAVLVSHDHYDHLDSTALKRLYDRNNKCEFFAGLNSQDVFPDDCRMNQLDWTHEKQIMISNKKFKITFVPACHWSRRGLFDKNYRLWGGFVIQSPTGKKVFYSGDTGYCSVFKEIGQVFKGFDLSILPIGAYHPREFLKSQHTDPQEAVTIHLELNSKKSVGVHWGTFALGYEHYTAAREDLQQALRRRRLDPECFITVDHGGHFQVDYI